MTDNTQLNSGSGGDLISTDDLGGGLKVQRVKVQHGVDGSATDVSSANPLPVSLPVAEPFARYMDVNGDGTGNKIANGDYSVTPAQFFIAPLAATRFVVKRVIVTIVDTNMAASEYGNLGGPLTNGVVVQKRTGSTTVDIDLTNGSPVLSNAGWGSLCYNADLKPWGAGDEFIVVRWTFQGAGILLDGDLGERFTVLLNDDFTGLTSHVFNAQGYIL